MQGDLFKNEKVKNVETGLIISKHQNKLGKEQQTFNKLVKRIEKLRLDLDLLKRSLDEKIEFYGKYIYPLERQLNDLGKKTARLLYRFFKNKKVLSGKERQSLGSIISVRLSDVFQFEKSEPEDDLKEIFKAVEGVSYEEVVEEDFAHMKNDMESVFEEFGFDVNLKDLHSKMTEEEVMRKIMEMTEKLNQQANGQNKKSTNPKKTKKQREKEEREQQIKEVRSKNIGSLYRQLAKVFHPDLEQDEELKLEKEELMKQLTIAYENNDLHTLLSLELAWIRKEENSPGKLTDSKLNIYNEVLKEQVFELEDEINNTYQHPRYQPLQKFASYPDMVKSINFKQHKQRIEAFKNVITQNVIMLEGNEKQSLATVKKIIRDYDMERRADEDFSRFF